MVKADVNSLINTEESVRDNLLIAKLKPPDQHYLRSVLERFDIQLPEDINLPEGTMYGSGLKIELGDEIRVSFNEDGSYEINLAAPNRSGTKRISEGRIKLIAFETIQTFGLDRDVTLVLDGLLHEYERAQGSESTSSEIIGPQSTQTTVLFRQVINGLRVLTPGAGDLRISIDDEGSVVKISSSTRQIREFTRCIGKTTVASPENYHDVMPKIPSEIWFEKMLNDETRKLLGTWGVKGQAPMQFAVIPGSVEIGYEIQGDEAVPGARRTINVDFGGGYHKLYEIKVVAC